MYSITYMSVERYLISWFSSIACVQLYKLFLQINIENESIILIWNNSTDQTGHAWVAQVSI